MKKLFLSSLFIVPTLLFLSGCSIITKEVPVYITKTEVVEVPPELLTHIKPSTPPDKQIYLSSDYKQKENLLINYSTLLLNDIESCNVRLDAIKKLNEKQKALYKKEDKIK